MYSINDLNIIRKEKQDILKCIDLALGFLNGNISEAIIKVSEKFPDYSRDEIRQIYEDNVSKK